MQRQLEVPFTHGTVNVDLIVTMPEVHEVEDNVRDRAFDHVFCEVTTNGLLVGDELNHITKGERGETETEVVWTNSTAADGWTITQTVVVKTVLTGLGQHQVHDLVAAAFAPGFGHSVSHFTRLTNPVDAIPVDLADALKNLVSNFTGMKPDGFDLVEVDLGRSDGGLLGFLGPRRVRKPRMATGRS